MGARGCVALGLLLLGLGITAQAKRTTRGIDFKTINPRGSDIRLPVGLVPVSYFLQLQPFLEQDTFRGHVFINMTVTDEMEQRDVITLHAGPEVHIKHVTLNEVYGDIGANSEMPGILSIERDTDNSILFVRLAKDLVPGLSYRIGAEFSGRMNNKSHEGLFKGHYVNQETGNTHYYLAAHFKPSFARNVFPCFDEPALKASVTVSIARPKDTDLRTISNMPHATTLPMINDISWVWDTFEASPPMSTYAITFLTSDLVAGPVQEPETEVSVPLRVWSRPALTEQTEWARRLAPRALAHIERTLRTRFPLPKVDLVALPGFNAPVPAENWGIIFYREGDILSGGGGYNRWVTSYVVNELVFQWVGGLVTPHWWSDTWVNRALANFLARSAAADMEPMDERLTHEQAPAAAVYALYYEYSKRSPYARLPSMRDIIAATKAEVIIRMLNYTLTEETFMSSLQDFFSEKSFTTYEQGDLWGAIGRRAHEDGTLPLTVSARAVAATWMGSERFPVLSVTRDYQGGLSLYQRAFIRDPVSEANDASAVEDDDSDGPEGLWWIPVVMAAHTRGGAALDLTRHAPAFWMPPTRRIDNLSDPAHQSRFLIVNPEDIGLFLVNYDKRNWQMLAEYLTREESRAGYTMVPPTTRAKLVHDALNLALGGILDFPTAFSMTRFLATETRYEPWHPFFNMADVLMRKLDGTAAGKLFGEYAVTLAAPLDKSLGEAGLGGEPAWRGKLRSHTRHLLCALGYEPCVQKARDIFARWTRSENPDANIPIPTRVFCAVFAWGSRDEWLFGLERLNRLPASKSAADRMYLLKTLSGCARDTWRIERLLNASLLQDAEPGSEPFSEADLRLMFGELAGRHSGYLTLFRFLEKNWDTLKDSFHGRPHLWTALVGAATGHFKTYDELQMVSELHHQRRGQFGAGEGAIRRGMERVELEATWSQRHLALIQGWLLDQLAS